MRFLVLAILIGAAGLYACSSSDDGGKATTPRGDAGATSGGGVPDPSTFFDSLPAATPDKLRGVWENKATQSNVEVATRLGFGDGFIGVAVKCTPPGATAFDVVGYDIDNPDTANGQFEYPGVTVSSDAGSTCGVQLPDGVLEYAVTGTTLKLTQDGADGEIAFTKVGDL